jgi:hypothetical protein
MTVGGVAFLTISWLVIIGFNVLCLRRLASKRTHDPAPKSPGRVDATARNVRASSTSTRRNAR